MSVLPRFDHTRPASLDEALGLISDDVMPYAGGTELLLAMKAGLIKPDRLVDLKRLDELTAITRTTDGVSIGAGVTHHVAASHHVVQSHLPMLASVLSNVGNVRVRASGTLGGNLCFAEPKSDVATALMALDASVVLRSSQESRVVAVEALFDGPYATVLATDELMVSIAVPLVEGRRSTYVKYQTMERPTVGVAIALDPDRCRVVVGAVGPVPQIFDHPDLSAVRPDRIAGEVDVMVDLTGADDYKRHVTAVYLRKAVERMRETS